MEEAAHVTTYLFQVMVCVLGKTNHLLYIMPTASHVLGNH